MRGARRCRVGVIGLLWPVMLSAQEYAVDRGSWQVGGRAGFQRSEIEIEGLASFHSTSAFLSPSLQYFVSPGFALGGEVSIARSSLRGNSQTVFGIGPAATYYFGQSARTWYPFLGASVSVAQNNVEQGDDNTEWRYRGAGGLLFMLSNAVGVNSELFYLFSRQSSDDEEADGKQFGLAFGISAFVF